MGVYTKRGRRVAHLDELWHRGETGQTGHPTHVYGKDKQEIVLNLPTLADFSWVALGDSLTDDTGQCGRTVPNKYHKLIRDAVGMTVAVHAKGSTGYWRTVENGTCFYQQINALTPDPTVDIVTLLGSINDWRVFAGVSMFYASNYNLPNFGFDKNGVMMTFADWHNPDSPRFVDKSHTESADVSERMALTDTAADTQNIEGGMSWVAYVNEAINACLTKYPNAKVLLINEMPFATAYHLTSENLQRIKKAIVEKRRAAGDTRLYLWNINECKFAGMEDPARLYVDTMPGEGLSFSQLKDETFRSYYTWDNAGHPNDLYNRLWLGPVIAHRLCLLMDVDPDTLPDSLRIPHGAI